MITSIDHIVLTSKNIKKTISFYCDFLGMKLEENCLEPNRGKKIFLKFGNQKINVHSENKPFICPLALPTDDIEPEHFKAFYCDGSKGLYIHPNIWHEGVFPVTEKQSFQGKQGKVHARVSIDLKEEFNKYICFKTAI